MPSLPPHLFGKKKSPVNIRLALKLAQHKEIMNLERKAVLGNQDAYKKLARMMLASGNNLKNQHFKNITAKYAASQLTHNRLPPRALFNKNWKYYIPLSRSQTLYANSRTSPFFKLTRAGKRIAIPPPTNENQMRHILYQRRNPISMNKAVRTVMSSRTIHTAREKARRDERNRENRLRHINVHTNEFKKLSNLNKIYILRKIHGANLNNTSTSANINMYIRNGVK